MENEEPQISDKVEEVTLQIRIPKELKRKVKVRCAECGITIEEYIRTMIEAELGEIE